MATFVLVHGAWQGGWCWQKLIPYLREAGHEVYAPTLSGLGERSHLSSCDIDLSCHIQDIVNVLRYQDLEDVILIGHSYGGMVITGVADKCPERLSQLVYLDALVPENGQSTMDQMAPTSTVPAKVVENSTKSIEGVPPESSEAMGITNSADIKWMEERVVPHPRGTLTEPLYLHGDKTYEIARTYISCTIGQTKSMPSIAQAAQRIQSESGWHYLELKSGHSAMIIVPKELAEMLISLVR